MRNPEKPNEKIEQALAALRADEPRPEALNAASEKVWQNLSVDASAEAMGATAGAIQGCESVRGLLPAWQRRELSPARALLVEDHLRECPACHQVV
jgi:hypothetical protein